MAKYNVTYECGHTGVVNIVGPVRDREWKKEREEMKLCRDCFKKQQEELAKQAAKKAREMELPELSGTPKQVAWAETLRQRVIEHFDDVPEFKMRDIKRSFGADEKGVREVLNYILENKTTARYYIDTRYADIYDYVRKEHKEALKPAEEKEAEQAEKERIAQIRAESTVYPKERVTDAVAEINFNDEMVATISERNEKFREIVKNLGYRWNGQAWVRSITQKTGTAEDRAAELGNRLLNAGFPIMILDPDVKQAAIKGDYEPEHKRWIGKLKDKDRFAISWADGTDMYKTARSLPGSKWERPFVSVSVNHFKAVEEFADLYDFKFTTSALEMIEKHKEKMTLSDVVEPTEIEEPAEPKDGLKEILESSDDILDDLKD